MDTQTQHRLDLGGQFEVGDRIRLGRDDVSCEAEVTETGRFHIVCTEPGAVAIGGEDNGVGRVCVCECWSVRVCVCV